VTVDAALRVVAGVILEGDRVLLARRPPGTHLAGYWEFPGGKVEPGEGEREALRRELREELGVEAEVGERLATVRHRYADRGPVVITFFACRLRGGPVRPSAGQEVRWVRRRDLPAYRLPPADAPLVRSLAGTPDAPGEPGAP
jgi:8-oxo-dGTP diphosphatase